MKCKQEGVNGMLGRCEWEAKWTKGLGWLIWNVNKKVWMEGYVGVNGRLSEQKNVMSHILFLPKIIIFYV